VSISPTNTSDVKVIPTAPCLSAGNAIYNRAGSRILFVCEVAAGTRRWRVANVDGGSAFTLMTPTGANVDAFVLGDWTLDDKKVVVPFVFGDGRANDIYTASAANQAASGDLAVLVGRPSNDFQPRIGPDGTIYFQRSGFAGTMQVPPSGGSGTAWKVNQYNPSFFGKRVVADSARGELLVDDKVVGKGFVPTWGRDGTTITFLLESYGPATLKMMDAAGKVSSFSLGSLVAPTW
jgi:hypothetical protein